MAKGQEKKKGKKKTKHGQGIRTGRITSLGIVNQLVPGHPPVPLCCHARLPEPAEMQHPPFTPAHEAITGPKQSKLTGLKMDATAAPTTGSPLPRAVLTLPMLLLSLPQLPSQPKQSLPTPCIEAEQGGSLLPLG